MGKKKKSAKNSNSEDNGSSDDDANNPRGSSRPPTRERNKSRLRRHRHSRGTSVANDAAVDSPDSAALSNPGKKKNRRRKQKKKTKRSSRAATATGSGTSEESSEWSSGHQLKRSRIPAPEKKKDGGPKELSEKDIVEWMQKMIPYVTFDSPFWNKWTLASFYHFIRNPNVRICIAFVWEGYDMNASSDTGVLSRLAKICRGPLITFNQLLPEYRGGFFYFLKHLPVAVDGLNYDEVVIFGNVPDGGDQVIVGLNNLLVHYWTPILFNEECLSEGIKEDVFSELNTVSCASQTAAYFVSPEVKHQLFLYIPPEVYREKGPVVDSNEGNTGEIIVTRSDHEMVRDKPFSARLEEAVVYWITKLKQVLILQELDDTDTWPGPLEEIQFWSGRSLNLKNILLQLDTRRVRRILRILAISHSPYLAELKDIFQKVGTSYHEASSNTHYLQPLKQPLEKLPKCKLKQVRVEMQKVIWLILMIWRNAPYYNSAIRLNSLLRKFSNVLVILCKSRIKVNEILEGVDLPKKERMLSSCLRCLEWWQEIFHMTEATFKSRQGSDQGKVWIFDQTQIFVHVEALILRIHNLQEVCLVQTLYKVDSFPLYPGIKGPYMTQVMKHCKQTITVKLQELENKSAAELVLNVKSTEWHEHMEGFRDTVLGMDMSVQNALEQVFEQMSNLKRKVELMQLFQRFYGKREVITRQLDRLCVQIYEHFEGQVKRLKKLFEKKLVPLPNTYTELAGRAAWAEFMKRKLDTDLDILKKAEPWLPKTSGVGFQALVKNEAKELAEAMAAFAGKVYEDWAKEFQDIYRLRENDHRGKLEVPLLIRGKGHLVKVNFDRGVYRNLSEAEMWKRLGRSVPPALLLTIYPWREKLHGLRENVGIVAKWYNRCVGGLSRDERLLFKDRLLPVETKLYPCVALEGYTWISEKTADQVFVDDFQGMATKVLHNLKEYRDATAKVVEIIDKIYQRTLVKVKGRGRRGKMKGVYEGVDEFRVEQNKRIERELKKNVKDYREIGRILRELFADLFQNDGGEVKVQWGKYVRLVDSCLEEALKLSVRNSLELLDAAVASDDREKPLFGVKMVLVESELKFEPPLEEIARSLLEVHGSIGTVIEPVVRLGRFLGTGKVVGEEEELSRGYENALMRDKICLDIQNRLAFAVERCLSEVNLYAERWIPYRDIWEVDRKEFMISYEKQYPDMAAYEKDLKRYKEISEVVLGAESTVTIRWLQVDCTGMKQGIAEESAQWFQTLAATLYERVKASLVSVYEYMEENRQILTTEPETLQEHMELWKVVLDVRSEVRQKMFSSFPGIHDRFKMLRQHNFEIEVDVEEMECGLATAWRKYLRFLRDIQDKLEKSRGRIKQAYSDQFDIFKGKTNDLQKLWDTNGPFARQTGEFGSEWALSELENFQIQVVTLKTEEQNLIEAFETLELKKEKNLVLIELEKDIVRLREVWKEVKECEVYWGKWKEVRIVCLELDLVKVKSDEFLKTFKQLHNQYEVKSWPIIQEGIEFIEVVQTSLKSCLFLRQQTLQSRHWEWIKGLVAKQQSIISEQLPNTTESLSLEMLINFQLHRLLGDISEISWSSEKEMAVEQTLLKIHDFWDGENFLTRNLKRSRGGVATDMPVEVLCSPGLEDTLMDHIVSLTAMKGSQFLGIFQEKVNYWEESLKMTEEVLEALWVTQRECVLLNRVFSNEHIQQALPRATRRYNVVSSVWAGIILIIIQVGNVLKVANETEDLVEMLEDLQGKMNDVRKEFEVYLQEIRQEFARFYFLSNDQLLTCLGGGAEVETLLEVMPKIFGNLGSIRVATKGENRTKIEITGIVSKNGEEKLTLTRPVKIGGEPLESLFGDLGREISCSVKDNLRGCLEQWGGNWNKMEKWLMGGTQWTAQSVLTAIKIQWTTDMCKVIQENKEIGSETGSLEGKREQPLKKVVKRIKKVVLKCTQTLREMKKGVKCELVNTMEAVLITLKYLLDVTERLTVRNCADLESFEWLQYLRWYWNGAGGSLVVMQGFATVSYGWEYCDAAASCRSCYITPLTERCFLAVMTAIGFQMGAVIHGERTSGKREMIRELGCQLGKFVMTLNVDVQTEMECLKGLISGVVQSGAWAVLAGLEKCSSDVVNLVVSKLALITKAKLGNYEKIMLDGIPSRLDKGCGIFVVMTSPGYGDLETLTTLKTVMRPVALIQPDYKNIMEMKYFLGGFENAASLAKKVEAIFLAAGAVAKEQFPNREALFSLSKMNVVVEQAVLLKHEFKKRISESEAVIKSLENLISPALVNKEETTAFWDLVKTNFPMEEIPPSSLKKDAFQLEYWVQKSITKLGYHHSEKIVQYCLRLHELIEVYKAVILVGKAASGKSVIRKVLKSAVSLLHCQNCEDNEVLSLHRENDKGNDSDSIFIKEFIINPATVDGTTQLFGGNGFHDGNINTWRDGILTKILKNYQKQCIGTKNQTTPLWLVFDGPVQDCWLPAEVEQLCREKGAITLANCDTVSVPKLITSFFEVDTLADASPGLLARCGVLYIDDVDESKDSIWRLSLEAWLSNLNDAALHFELDGYVRKVLKKCLKFRKENCTCLIPTTDGSKFQLTQMFMVLLAALLNEDVQKATLKRKDKEEWSLAIKQITAFSVVWSLFVGLDSENQQKASVFLKDLPPLQTVFPAKRTVFDYYLDPQKQKWVRWENLVEMAGELKILTRDVVNRSDSFEDHVMVSTVDTIRAQYFLKRYCSSMVPEMARTGLARPVLVCGPSDSGKTKLVTSTLDPSFHGGGNNNMNSKIFLSIQMTSKLTAWLVQSLIETRLEAVSSIGLSPGSGKLLTVFIDDISSNNPLQVSSYGEFIRYFIDYAMWYDQATGAPKAITGVGVVAAMRTDGSGCALLEHRPNFPLSARLYSQFSLVYLPRPDEFQLRRIFTQKVKRKLETFAPAVKLMADDLTVATLDIYKAIQTEFHACQKSSGGHHAFHVFNLCDLFRVYDGLSRAHRDGQDTKLGILRLWFHECTRVFCDRLIDSTLRGTCIDVLETQLLKHFDLSVASLFPTRPNETSDDFVIFGNFVTRSTTSRKCYYGEIKMTPAVSKLILKKMKNAVGEKKPVVLFKESILQVAKIARILSQKKGHLIICGKEGQGREMLTQVAALLYNFKIFRITSAAKRNFPRRSVAIWNILKEAYIASVVENVGCCVILKDEQITEATLEWISLLTSNAEIPQLFTKKEIVEMTKTSDEHGDNNTSTCTHDKLMAKFKERIQNNFHVVFCVKPCNVEFLSNVASNYAALLKNMTVVWCDIWTPESLLQVAFNCEISITNTIFYTIHAIAVNEDVENLRITPIHFLDFLDFYIWYRKTAAEEYAKKMKTFKKAIQEIGSVRSKIGDLTEKADSAERKANLSRKECESMLAVIQKQETDTKAQDTIVREQSGQMEEEIKEYEELAAIIKSEWTEALSNFETEAECLQDLGEEDLTHIRSYYSAPPLISRVLDAVMIMLDRDQTWPEAKIQLGLPGFIQTILEYDKARISQEKLHSLRKFIQNKEFTPEAVSKYSNGARILCAWIHAIEKYGKCYLSKICPKREKLEGAEQSILEHKHTLTLASEKLQLLQENLTEIQTIYETKWQLKESLENDARNSNNVLDRATSVLQLLEQKNGDYNNHVRTWKNNLMLLEQKLEELEGNSLLTAAYLAYCGPFSRNVRKVLKDKWSKEIESGLGVLVPKKWRLETALDFERLVQTPDKVQMLLTGFYSWKDDEDNNKEFEWLVENILMIKKSRRLVLCLDPHGVIQNETEKTVTKVNTLANLMEYYEKNVQAEVESTSENVIFVTHEVGLEKIGKRLTSRFAVVNCTLSKKGLRDYFTRKIAEMIFLQDETKRQNLVHIAIAEKLRMDEFLEKIPDLVITCGGTSILNNGHFPETLSQWRDEIQQSKEKLEAAEFAISEIELDRHQFLYTAAIFTRIFETLSEMSKICSFYELSLEYFTGLIQNMTRLGLDKKGQQFTLGEDGDSNLEAPRRDVVEKLVDFMDEKVTLNLYDFISRSMKKAHRYQFSLLLSIKTMFDLALKVDQKETLKQTVSLLVSIRPTETDWLKKYKQVDDEKLYHWLISNQQENLKRLGKLKVFYGLVDSIFTKDSHKWREWMQASQSEKETSLPGNWESKVTPLEKLLLIIILRPSLIPNQIQQITEDVLGAEYSKILVSSQLVNVKEFANGSSINSDTLTPSRSIDKPIVIFLVENHDKKNAILDPQSSVQALACSLKPPQNLYTLSITKNSIPLARTLIEEGSHKGFWVYISNSDKMWHDEWFCSLEEMLNEFNFHRNFKLWMCAQLNQPFRRNVIQNSVKVVVDSPSTLQLSVDRLQQKIGKFSTRSLLQQFEHFPNLLNSLCYLHCQFQWRAKFHHFVDSLEKYPVFQDNDFEVSLSILNVFCQKYLSSEEQIMNTTTTQFPWWALKLMLELQYINHFSTTKHHQLVRVLLQKVISSDFNYKLASEMTSGERVTHDTDNGDIEDYDELPSNVSALIRVDLANMIIFEADQFWKILESLIS